MRKTYDTTAIMRHAHVMARELVQNNGGTYRSHFGWALRMAWWNAKRAAEPAHIKQARETLRFIERYDYLTPADRELRASLQQQIRLAA